ncbi:MAG: ATP-binding protein [Nitrososphaera sp.]
MNEPEEDNTKGQVTFNKSIEKRSSHPRNTKKVEENIGKDRFEIPTDREKGFPLLQIISEYYNFDDLIVKDEIKQRLETLISENKMPDRLLQYGLKPKQKVLFCGPPGTGKTLTAKVISSVMGFPLVHVRFDSIVSSYLGETASNLRRIFNFIEKGRWVVLFDEFDIVGKKRDDPHEHGEVKRVVNNFMQMLDGFQGQSIIIAATNHEYLLDTAIWRRFDDVIFFGLPDKESRELLFKKYLRVLKKSPDVSIAEFSGETEGFSGADVAQVCNEALRRSLLRGREEVKRDDVLWAIALQKRRMELIAKGTSANGKT